MGRKTGSWNRHGPISDSPHGKFNEDEEIIGVAGEMDLDPEQDEQDPLDHDGDGRKGGSQKGAKSTRAKGAAKAKAEEPETETLVDGTGDDQPEAEVATEEPETTEHSENETQQEEFSAESAEDEVVETVEEAQPE